MPLDFVCTEAVCLKAAYTCVGQYLGGSAECTSPDSSSLMGETVLGAGGTGSSLLCSEGGVSVRDECPGVGNPTGKAHWFLLSFFLIPQ